MRPHVAADPNPVSQTFLAAAKELGYPAADDFNGEAQKMLSVAGSIAVITSVVLGGDVGVIAYGCRATLFAATPGRHRRRADPDLSHHPLPAGPMAPSNNILRSSWTVTLWSFPAAPTFSSASPMRDCVAWACGWTCSLAAPI
jgi:hypothetical protein